MFGKKKKKVFMKSVCGELKLLHDLLGFKKPVWSIQLKVLFLNN